MGWSLRPSGEDECAVGVELLVVLKVRHRCFGFFWCWIVGHPFAGWSKEADELVHSKCYRCSEENVPSLQIEAVLSHQMRSWCRIRIRSRRRVKTTKSEALQAYFCR